MTMGTSYSEGSWHDAKAITLRMRKQGNRKKKFPPGQSFFPLYASTLSPGIPNPLYFTYDTYRSPKKKMNFS